MEPFGEMMIELASHNNQSIRHDNQFVFQYQLEEEILTKASGLG
jgi:hypothetical protein